VSGGFPDAGGRSIKKLLTTPAIELAATNERGPCANHWANLLVEMKAPEEMHEPLLPRQVPVGRSTPGGGGPKKN
jgi:hypothetical protein